MTAEADTCENTTVPTGGKMLTTTEPSRVAEVVEYDNVTMLATSRCDSCGGQAYVEVQLEGKEPLRFCGHHATLHWSVLVTLKASIADHRPFLLAQEGRPRDAASAAN